MTDPAGILGQIAFILLSAGAGIGLCVAFAALVPEHVARRGDAIRERPMLCSLAGLLAGAPLLVLLLHLMGQLPEPHRPLLLVPASVLLLAAMAGVAAIACAIGRRLGASEPAPAALRGAAVLALIAAAPIPGWFLVLPLLLVLGFGAVLIRRRG